MGASGPIAGDPEKLKGHRKAPSAVDLSPPPPDATPRRLRHASRYRHETRRWWRTWATSPQAGQFGDLDWLRFELLADLVDAFYATDDWRERVRLLGEIRRQESAFGATIADRARLRWRIAGPVREPEPTPEPGRQSSRERGDPRLQLVGGGPCPGCFR